MAYFPMFVELRDQKCLIVGGGHVAKRKVQVLKDFGAEITLTAPQVMEELREDTEIRIVEKDFEESDLEGMDLVVAATDEKTLNHRIAELCRARRIPVNAVDQIEDFSFIFPAYLRSGEVVSAFCSSGLSPVITQYLKSNARQYMTEEIGTLAAYLGSLRNRVKRELDTEQQRKQFYQEILTQVLSGEDYPTEESLGIMINNIKNDI